MPTLDLEHISKRYGPLPALSDVNLAVYSGELFFLLGPSGCGKTTLLRVVAGFCEPDTGTLRFGDRLMNRVPPHRRNTGMVFQSYALWPHLNVFDNVAYGLEVRRIAANERRQLVTRMLDMVGLGDSSEKFPNQLSGGQQQRVALARALVVRPDILLLDEPLSNLDATLRYELRHEIRRIHDETRITTLYVTHDQKEALSIADRVAVMDRGRIEQVGEPRQIYRRPVNRFVAGFLGEANFISGRVLSCAAGAARVETAAGTILADDLSASFPAGAEVVLGIRPECLRIAESSSGARGNRVAARLERVGYLGEQERMELRLSAPAVQGVAVKATRLSSNDLRLHPGGEVTLEFSPSDVMVLPS